MALSIGLEDLHATEKAQTFVPSASDAGRPVSRLLVVPPPIKKLSVALPLWCLDLPAIQQIAVFSRLRPLFTQPEMRTVRSWDEFR